MAGLPRSGSTLIASILNQNPAIHASANSPMCGVMFSLERTLLSSEQWAAHPKPQVMRRTLMGPLEGWYSDTDAEHVIDKSREWAVPSRFQMLQRALGYSPKVIVPVRTVTDILASFIALTRKDPETKSFIDRDIEARKEPFYRPVDDVRCDSLMRSKGLIDTAMFGVAYAAENRDSFHLIEYDDLLAEPGKQIDGIYDFLGIERFDHDYGRIMNVTPESDKPYGLAGMHDVRPSISRSPVRAEEILSPYVLRKYGGSEVWR